MAHRGSPSDLVRSLDVGIEEHRRLDVTLRLAEVATGDIDAARVVLLDRLSRRSDDFAATTALQALNTYVAGQRYDSSSPAPAPLRDVGLSSWQRMGRHRAGGAT